MKRVLIYCVCIFFSGLVFSCKPTKICPAYHSSFIIDREVTRTTFSLFGPDSLPKDPEEDLWIVDKKKVGIADDFSYKKKTNKMAIISMESIYLKKEDPLDMQLAMAEMDSAAIDSVMYHRQSQQYDDFYNYDQMIYLHYFGDYLPKPKSTSDFSEDLKQDESLIQDESTDELEEKEKKGFLKGLFKKKNKKEEAVEDEEEEVDDSLLKFADPDN